MNKPYAVLFKESHTEPNIVITVADHNFYYHANYKVWSRYFVESRFKKLHRSEIDISTAVKILKLLGYNETKTR